MKLEIKNLSKKYEKNEVLKSVNFTFEKGKIYGLLGRNGSGKTTLFNCLNEDLPFDTGELTIIEERVVRKLNTDDIGYVLSTPVVPDFLTANEFLKFYLDVNKEKMNDIKTMNEYFNIVSIKEKDRNKLLRDYSHGMKNKMQMLINIISKPKVLLLDEPLTSFDVVVAEEMKELLRNSKKDSIIIFSTHIMELALDLCDEIVLLNKGSLELISNDVKNNEELKTKIIDSLKGGEEDENA